LTASIAHEVNQPLAAIAINGEVGLRLLNRSKPDLAELRELSGRPFPSATLPIAGACRFLVRLPAARILFGLSHDQSPAVQRPPCRA
jgi:hypothetical protein